MGYAEQNIKKIESSIRAIVSGKDLIFRTGIERTLDEGAKFCIQAHNEGTAKNGSPYHYSHHLEMADTYGWVLYHDSKEVSRHIVETNGESEVKGKVGMILTNMSRRAGSGYAGFVVAAMDDGKGHTSYFHWEAEIKMIRMALLNLKALDYSQIFKRI